MADQGVTMGFAVIRITIIVSAILAFAYLVAYLIKRRDEKRDKEALTAYQNEWGEEMCNWLIENEVPLNSRTIRIMGNLKTWGKEGCKRVIQKRIAAGDNVDMVVESFGKPDSVDHEAVTQKGKEYRWVYGGGATYVWFKDDVVTRIET